MTISFMTLALIFGGSILGLVLVVYKIQRDNARYIDDLEFFIEKKTVAFNKEKAVGAVLKTRFEQMSSDLEASKAKLKSLVDREDEFHHAIRRCQVLESKLQQFQKLENDISKIQVTLSGPVKKQLADAVKSVESVSQKLDNAAVEFSEQIQNLDHDRDDQAA